jgi:hypothetical protein
MEPAALQRAIEREFSFLCAEYGFRRLGARRAGSWVVVPFRGERAGVDVGASNDRAEVTIGRLDRAGRMRAFERDDWGHWWWVIQDLVGDGQVRKQLARRDKDIVALLREHARALRGHGRAALSGDFTELVGIDWWQARDA